MNNDLIKATWSERVTTFEKRVNIRNFLDQSFQSYERLLTFEGPSFYSRMVSVKSTQVIDSIRDNLTLIVRHINALRNNKILVKQMIFYLKIDRKNVANLLFCSVESTKQVDKIVGIVNE